MFSHVYHTNGLDLILQNDKGRKCVHREPKEAVKIKSITIRSRDYILLTRPRTIFTIFFDANYFYNVNNEHHPSLFRYPVCYRDPWTLNMT